jgi:hypothetical protein
MRRKWLIYVLTFSLALNGATAAGFIFFWLQNQTLAAASVGQKPIGSFLQEDLKLTGDQANRILSLIHESKQEVEGLRAQTDAKRAELMKLISSVPVSKDAVITKLDEIGLIQGRLRSAAVNTVITVVESLPPESRDKFAAYVKARGRACDVVGPPTAKGGNAVSGSDNQRGYTKGTEQSPKPEPNKGIPK